MNKNFGKMNQKEEKCQLRQHQAMKHKERTTFRRRVQGTIGFLLIVIATLGTGWFSVSALRFENGLKNMDQVGESILIYKSITFSFLEYFQCSSRY